MAHHGVNPQNEIERILRERHAVLVRTKRHQVWRLDNGGTFVRSTSASDRRALSNQLRDLKRLEALPAGAVRQAQGA